MMIRWTTLQQELGNDPLNLGYAAALVNYDEATLLQLLNDPSVMAPKSTLHSERGVLDKYPDGPLAADLVLRKLEAFSASPHPFAGIVKRALKFLSQPEGIDFGAASTITMLQRLAQGGVITQDEADKLAGIGTVLVSRAEQLGLRIVTAEQLYVAVFDENGDRLLG
jgi:hypothetical protein